MRNLTIKREKSFLGLRLFKVETGSMIPKYNINDVIKMARYIENSGDTNG